MKPIIYQIDFFTNWHTSSGLSGSTYADLLVIKTSENLPFIPGKTLKGLLREAAESIHELNKELVTADFIGHVFGLSPTKKEMENEVYTKEAACYFSNAYLSKKLTSGITKEKSSHLYKVISSTKIDKNGIAEDSSLRQLEVTIPLILYAKVEHFPNDEAYLTQLEHCLSWVKRIGLNRSRGLGRCKFSILKES
ncbi:MAG: RAMP superfamily CRISPR-associated protein [Saprospiraceae bacterium]|nr:RAMP superfamily CRISPR-associated protein [Saprospiraceae bacterium]